MFTHGVHRARGPACFELAFKRDEMNGALKSLALYSPKSVTRAVVMHESGAPAERALARGAAPFSGRGTGA